MTREHELGPIDALGDRLDRIDAVGCIDPYRSLGAIVAAPFAIVGIVLIGQEGAFAVVGGAIAAIGLVLGGLVVHRYDPRRRIR